VKFWILSLFTTLLSYLYRGRWQRPLCSVVKVNSVATVTQLSTINHSTFHTIDIRTYLLPNCYSKQNWLNWLSPQIEILTRHYFLNHVLWGRHALQWWKGNFLIFCWYGCQNQIKDTNICKSQTRKKILGDPLMFSIQRHVLWRNHIWLWYECSNWLRCPCQHVSRMDSWWPVMKLQFARCLV
jgi:hypothetical protein